MPLANKSSATIAAKRLIERGSCDENEPKPRGGTDQKPTVNGAAKSEKTKNQTHVCTMTRDAAEGSRVRARSKTTRAFEVRSLHVVLGPPVSRAPSCPRFPPARSCRLRRARVFVEINPEAVEVSARARAPRALRARCGGFAAAARGSAAAATLRLRLRRACRGFAAVSPRPRRCRAAAAPLRLRRRRACRGSAAAIPRGVRSSRLRRRLSAFLMRCSSSSFSFPSSSGSCSSPSRPTRRGRHPPRP